MSSDCLEQAIDLPVEWSDSEEENDACVLHGIVSRLPNLPSRTHIFPFLASLR